MYLVKKFKGTLSPTSSIVSKVAAVVGALTISVSAFAAFDNTPPATVR